MPRKIENEPQRSEFWTQIWLLKNKDSSGKFNYFKGLTLKERQALANVFTDALEVERQVLLGEDFAPAIPSSATTPAANPAAVATAKKSEVHTPSLYSMGEKNSGFPGPKRSTRAANAATTPRAIRKDWSFTGRLVIATDWPAPFP